MLGLYGNFMAMLALMLSTAESFQVKSPLPRAQLCSKWKQPSMLAKPPKWASQIDDFKERIESGKAAVTGAVVGSVSFAPFDFAINFGNSPQVL